MTTLIPTSQQQQTTATPAAAAPAGVESYEDMFKEITRKLYGDESAHGLYPINNAQVAQLAQTPSAPPEGERSFTTLVSDRNLALEYENVMPTEIATGNFKSEEHLSTAFGLAALMHNGFPPPTINFPVTSANNVKQTTQASEDRQWNQQQQNHHHQNQSQQQQDEGGITWSSNTKAANTYTQKLFKVKTKQEPVAQEIVIQTSTNNVVNGTNIKSENTQIQKRYNCSVCPYSTDRRDLFTRHENIHKEEKPFHCYACLKQFNRADHVKKHFLRMHREMEYDINKTRRYPPSSKQVNSVVNSNNNSTKTNNNYFYNQQQQQQQSTEPQLLVGTTINIPTFSQNQTNNGNAQQQQQQQQQHTTIIEHVVQNTGNNSGQTNVPTVHQVSTVNIKSEKISPPKTQKTKGEKRFMCCYCPWSGADNWGLKRHLNTHTKPFVCLLCDYKAARSERLTTHIFKVHNKKACNKCNFFADDQAQLAQHQLDAHQLQMQALSRNTASVSQDFRSAGGENFITNAIQQQNKGNITLTSLNRDATDTNGAIGVQQRRKTKAMSPIDHSPPAVTFKAIGRENDGFKRRRKMSPLKDKENVNELLTKQLTFLKQQQMIFLKNLNESVMSDSERVRAVQEINEIFEKMYDHSMSVISSIDNENHLRGHQEKEKFSLPDFLTNNNEITVIMEPKSRQQDQSENRKNRKQLKPKKIEKPMQIIESTPLETPRNILSDLRDKHMVYLVARKKYCFLCRNKSSDVNTFYNKTSLLLHKLWRHSSNKYECHCQVKFNSIYKLKLHKKLKQH